MTRRRPSVPACSWSPNGGGLNDYAKGRARQLAQLGYVALAVDRYGGGQSTTDPKRAGELAGQFHGKPRMAERAQAALDQLLMTGLVDDKKVAAPEGWPRSGVRP